MHSATSSSSTAASSTPPRSTHYEVLSLEPSATPAQIKAAYHEAVRNSHPDKGNYNNNNDTFCRVQTAWKCLSDPVSRCEYDEKLQSIQRRATVQRASATIVVEPVDCSGPESVVWIDSDDDDDNNNNNNNDDKGETAELWTFSCRCGQVIEIIRPGSVLSNNTDCGDDDDDWRDCQGCSLVYNVSKVR